MAKHRGYTAFGLEPNEIESSYAIDHEIDVLGKTISDLSKDSMFDVVTMWDVLEHIDSPSEFISDLKYHLKPGGVIYVQIPTCDSIAARIMREKSKCLMA